MQSAKYDVTTDIGKVRLWTGDTDNSNYINTDAEITYFLSVATQVQSDGTRVANHKLAAAAAIRSWISSQARLAKVVKLGTLSIDKSKIPTLLTKQAEDLEKSALAVSVVKSVAGNVTTTTTVNTAPTPGLAAETAQGGGQQLIW